MKSLITISVIWLLASVPLYAQQVWPGDVTNNGIVNQVDVMYWAYAHDAVGSPRNNPDHSWTGHVLPDNLWAEEFPNGLNFAYADCNGNGIIDSVDLDIIKEHYWFERDSVNIEDIPVGIPGVDPPLTLLVNSPYTSPNEEEEIFISLGDEDITIDSLFGISFTLHFNPADIKDLGGDGGFSLEILENTWFTGDDGNQSGGFSYVNRSSGVISVILYREVFNSIGWGNLAKLEYIIEDFVVFSHIDFELDSAVYYNFNLKRFPLVPKGITLEVVDAIDPSHPEGDNEEDTPGTIKDAGVTIYPNPASGRTLIESKNKGSNKLKLIQVLSLGGNPIEEIEFIEPVSKYLLDANNYAPGFYVVRVETEQGISSKPLVVVNIDSGIGQ
ncbi:MAG: T9SS type A sorting domain-containing protein [Chitinophagales bacterium]|nr:T9SS type A sorting domain-containing protein [Chitinophagales bacterium]